MMVHPGNADFRSASGAGKVAEVRDEALYGRYLRALALLCECAPYVDDEDYVALIDALLDDAREHYPLVVRRDGDRREIATHDDLGR